MTFDSSSLLEWFREHVDHPVTVRELVESFKIRPADRAAFRRAVRRLVASGELVQTRHRHIGLPERMHLVRGRLSMHPNGFAFVHPDDPSGTGPRDIYIGQPHVSEAMHDDRVLVRVDRVGRDGRSEGRVVRVLERRSDRIVGRYETDRAGFGYVVPFDRRLLADIRVPAAETLDASKGDMVVVAVTAWPTATRGPVGRVVEVLGAEDAPGVDLQIIVRKHNLPEHHSERAEREAARFGTRVRDADIAGRSDFRDLEIVTIDGEHARDFDDAISLVERPGGRFWLGVHIADVSHYVQPDSALDRDAADRATSVYFPERALHMFPEAMATGLCSLNPGVDRLVQSVFMEIDAQGTVVRSEFHEGVIHSRARMTYTAVNAILTDRDPATIERYRPLVPLFERMAALFEILNRRRRRRGAIDFDLPEPDVVLDADGLVEEILVAERNVAHRLIEEFMLLANETVAAHIQGAGVGTLFRVHEAPDPLKVEEFQAFIGPLGHSLGRSEEVVTPADFQRLVERIRGRPEERAVALLMLRTMQKARYDPVDLGHYGLATDHYAHFTSPIRRYPDLVVHRTLRALRQGGPQHPLLEVLADELPDLARHTSERERRADEAERELVQWKKVRFMADKVGNEYDGYVTGVAPFGLFVEMVEHFVEGLVHVSTMADDYYRFLEREHALWGESGKRRYRLGDRVRVQVLRADTERRQVEFGLVDVLERVRTAKAQRSAGPKRREKGARAKGRPGRRERQVRKATSRR
ncbi:MAG: ribonuclease R [Vicinamibacterales bacterium]